MRILLVLRVVLGERGLVSVLYFYLPVLAPNEGFCWLLPREGLEYPFKGGLPSVDGLSGYRPYGPMALTSVHPHLTSLVTSPAG